METGSAVEALTLRNASTTAVSTLLETEKELLSQTLPPLPMDEETSTLSESHEPMVDGIEKTTIGTVAASGVRMTLGE
jgi:hypothetical protein